MNTKNANVLKDVRFIKLWIANLSANIGDSMDNIVITLLAIALTDSASATGYLLSIASIPGIVLSIIGGTVSDIVKKNKILFWMTSIQGAIVLVMAILTFSGKITFTFLCVFLFLLECCSRFYSPAFTALNVSIVPKEQYSKVQSFITTTTSLAQMIGSSVCTSLITFLGYGIPLLMNSLFYFLSSVIIKFTDLSKGNIKAKPLEETSENKQKKFIFNLADGFRYLHKKSLLIEMIVILVTINLFLGLFDVGLPFLISEKLNLPTEYLGYMKSVSTFSFIISGIFVARKKFKNPILAITLSISIMGFCVGGIGISDTFFVTAILWGIAAFSRTIAAILLTSNIATLPHKTYVGRVMGIVATISAISTFISRAASGVIVDAVGAKYIFIVSGIVFILLSVFTLIIENTQKGKEDN